MLSRFSDFRYKEVINVRSGQRLGYVCDALFTTPEEEYTEYSSSSIYVYVGEY